MVTAAGPSSLKFARVCVLSLHFLISPLGGGDVPTCFLFFFSFCVLTLTLYSAVYCGNYFVELSQHDVVISCMTLKIGMENPRWL